MNPPVLDAPLSLFGGMDSIVAGWLDITSYRHRSALIGLSEHPPEQFDGVAFVETAFRHILQNWRQCLAAMTHNPSNENWRWFNPKLGISPQNQSPEVTLERLIVNLTRHVGREDWSNQVPVGSGLIKGGGDRRRAVDLVRRVDDNAFELIELKIESDNALYAGIEILQYGIIWLLSREHRKFLGYSDKPLLDASTVKLVVLAPANYYAGLKLSWFEDGLNRGLKSLGRQYGNCDLSFAYQAFPSWFSWPGTDSAKVIKALEQRMGAFR